MFSLLERRHQQIENAISFFVVVRLLFRAGGVSYCGASPGPAYPSRQLDVLLHDGDPLGVDGAQVDVFEEVDEEGLGGFLQGLDGLRLPPELLAYWSVRDCDLANLKSWVSVQPILCAVNGDSREEGWLTSLAKGSFRSSRSVVLWYCRISLNALVPGRYLYLLP